MMRFFIQEPQSFIFIPTHLYMKKIILFGATVNLGKEIAKEAVHRGYTLTVVIRNKNKSSLFHNIPIT
jgi:short-subunit dehydrogenase